MRSLDVFVCVRNIFPQHRRQQSVVHTLHYHHHHNRGVRVVESAFPGKSVKGASPTLRIIGLGSGFPPSGPHDSRGADSRESPSGLGNGFTHQQKKKKESLASFITAVRRAMLPGCLRWRRDGLAGPGRIRNVSVCLAAPNGDGRWCGGTRVTTSRRPGKIHIRGGVMIFNRWSWVLGNDL